MAGQIIRDASAQRWELPPMLDAAVVEPVNDVPAPPTVAELEALEQQAREEGYAAGRAQGQADAAREAQAVVRRLEGMLASAARPLEGLDDATEQELARLAVIVARRVLAHELATSPALVVQAVQQAARALPAATRELRVRVHPDDLAILREQGIAEQNWQLLPDPELARGDCMLESERSRLDARVETRLAAVVDAVLGSDDEDDGGDEVTA